MDNLWFGDLQFNIILFKDIINTQCFIQECKGSLFINLILNNLFKCLSKTCLKINSLKTDQ